MSLPRRLLGRAAVSLLAFSPAGACRTVACPPPSPSTAGSLESAAEAAMARPRAGS